MDITYLQSCLLKDIRELPKALSRLEKKPSRYSIRPDLQQLVSLGLITSRDIEDDFLYSCTSLGKELADAMLQQDQIEASKPVSSRTIPIPKDVYLPGHNMTYVRNNGNKHIPSRGM